jgi:hypothetical protein
MSLAEAVDMQATTSVVRDNSTATEPLLQNIGIMKWTGIYLLGFVVMLGGIIAALWKTGFLERIGTTWTIIGVVIALGIGIMIAVANSGRKESIQIEK